MKKRKKNGRVLTPSLSSPVPSLALYAADPDNSRGRDYPEKPHALRSPYQRDRDRILYCTAFRRLQYKTQVFVNHEGDHFRTRLTHTLETSQIASTVARTLRLNEDLAQAVAFGHDLGHGPFGHAGEWALAEKMKAHGGFEHNRQALRIVEVLEDSYADFPGLNLTRETRDGLMKHPEQFSSRGAGRVRTLEAEIVDVSDEIAYSSHDLDDGLRARLLSEEQLAGLSLWKAVSKDIAKGPRTMKPHQRTRLGIRLITDLLVADFVRETARRIRSLGLETFADVQKVRQPVAGFSERMARQHQEMKSFLRIHLYQHYHVVRMTTKGQRFIKALFDAYTVQPRLLPPDVLAREADEGLPRAICDYLAGMTDRYATEEYSRLFEPSERLS